MLVSISLAGLWIRYEFSKGPPWDAFSIVEKSWWTTAYVLNPFIQSFTLFYPFIIVLLILTPFHWSQWSKQIQRSIFLSATWCFLPIALIYISQLSWFPIANGRIASDVSPVPYGILSTIGVYVLWEKIQQFPVARFITIAFCIVVFTISICFSAIYFNQALRAQDNAVYNEGFSWTLYPTQNLWNGMMELKKVPPYSHVMILPRIGELITAYVPIVVYQSAPLNFTDWLFRRGQSHQFYTGTMNVNDMRELLLKNKISYVYWGNEEKTALLTPSLYPEFLDILYQNPEVTIFKVKNL